MESEQTKRWQAAGWQATLFDFAITELVRQHRESFPPLWSVESWAKLLIWLALNCGCAPEAAALEGLIAVPWVVPPAG